MRWNKTKNKWIAIWSLLFKNQLGLIVKQTHLPEDHVEVVQIWTFSMKTMESTSMGKLKMTVIKVCRFLNGILRKTVVRKIVNLRKAEHFRFWLFLQNLRVKNQIVYIPENDNIDTFEGLRIGRPFYAYISALVYCFRPPCLYGNTNEIYT